MLTLMIILGVIYICLKVYNTNDELKRRDAKRAAEERARAEAMEEALEEAEEEEEIRSNAVDVDAEVVDDAEEFFVEEAGEPVDIEAETAKIETVTEEVM